MKALRVLVANLVLLALAILVLELIFGSWIHTGAIDPLDRLRVPRSVKLERRVTSGQDAWNVTYTRDRFGLRGSYGDPSSVGLVTLGGSTTDQRMLDDADTWQEVMARLFAGAGLHVSVANAGIDGHSTVGHILALDTWLSRIPELKADWILVYAGLNERSSTADWVPELTEQGTDGDWTLARRIAEKSALYSLFRTAEGLIAAEVQDVSHDPGRRPLGHWQTVPYRFPTPPPTEVALLERYHQRILVLASRIGAMGAEPIFVTQPLADFQREDDLLRFRSGASPLRYFRIRTLADVTMDACREARAICLDLEKDVRFSEGDFYDAMHNTPAGAEKIGTYLFQQLRPHVEAERREG
jgi:hypothetical protein